MAMGMAIFVSAEKDSTLGLHVCMLRRRSDIHITPPHPAQTMQAPHPITRNGLSGLEIISGSLQDSSIRASFALPSNQRGEPVLATRYAYLLPPLTNVKLVFVHVNQVQTPPIWSTSKQRLASYTIVGTLPLELSFMKGVTLVLCLIRKLLTLSIRDVRAFLELALIAYMSKLLVQRRQLLFFVETCVHITAIGIRTTGNVWAQLC